MHAAEAPAKGAAFVDFEVDPFPNAEIFGNGVAIVAGDLEVTGVLRDESALSDLPYVRQDVGWLDVEPLAAAAPGCEATMQIALGLEIVGRRDPAQEFEFERIARLQVALLPANLLGNADLDRRAPVFVLAYEVNRHRPCPVASVSTFGQSFP
jgi:hypothetical protein